MTRRRSVLIPAPLKPMIMELACAKANPAENVQTAKDTTSTAMLITLVLLEVILGMIKVVPDCANRRPAPPSTHYPARLYVNEAGLFDLLQNARVHQTRRFGCFSVRRSQRVESTLDAVRFRDGILTQALGGSIVELLLNCRLFNAALVHHGIGRCRSSLVDGDSFDIGQEYSTHGVPLGSDEGRRKRDAESRVVQRQLGKIRQHAAASCSHNLVKTLRTD